MSAPVEEDVDPPRVPLGLALRVLAERAVARPRRRRTRIVVLAVLTALAAACLVAAALTWFGDDRARQDAAVAAAGPLITDVLSYDQARFDADVARATEGTTGAFREEFTALVRDGLREAALRQHAVARADVREVAAVGSRDDGVDVLAFVNQTIQRDGLASPRIDTVAVEAHLVEDRGAWRLSSLRQR